MPIYKIGKDKNGAIKYRVVINYTDSSGNYVKKTKTVIGMAEAKQEESRMMLELDLEDSSSTMTVYKLFEEYMKEKKYEIRQTTYEKVFRILNCHVIPFFCKTKLEHLDSRCLQKWKNYINEKDLAITSKKKIFTEFKAMLNFAVRMDYLTKNPLEKISNFKEVYFEKPQDKLRYYTFEEFKKYIAVADRLTQKPQLRGYYVFFQIAFYTGMRKGEINALCWNDLEGNIIHIRRSVSQKVKGESIVETPPKNSRSYRDIQIPRQLIEILKKHKELHQKLPNFSESFRICGGAKCLSDTSISDFNNLFAKEAGLPHITIHDFRHSHASLLANEGINIQEIARRLGHADVKETWNTYAHLYPREEERAVFILENL